MRVSLQVAPYTLAENAGLNPIAIVTELRNMHAKGEVSHLGMCKNHALFTSQVALSVVVVMRHAGSFYALRIALCVWLFNK